LNSIDEHVSRGTLPPEFHYEVLVFSDDPPPDAQLPDVGTWASNPGQVNLTVTPPGVRTFDPRDDRLTPWNPAMTPDVNPWPIP
jgi:hypothetical protein